LFVIPAQAGIQWPQERVFATACPSCCWIPACAGMTTCVRRLSIWKP